MANSKSASVILALAQAVLGAGRQETDPFLGKGFIEHFV